MKSTKIVSLEQELFKKKQAIVKLKNKNKVISIDDIEMFLMSQALGPIQNEVSIGVLNAYSSAYNRFVQWEKNLSKLVKTLLFLIVIPFMSFSQDIRGDWFKKTDNSNFNLSFSPIDNTNNFYFEIIGNTYSYDPFIQDTVNFPAHIGSVYGKKDNPYFVELKNMGNYLYGYYNDKESLDKETYNDLYYDYEEPCLFEFFIFIDSILVNINPICNVMYGGFSTEFGGTYLK